MPPCPTGNCGRAHVPQQAEGPDSKPGQSRFNPERELQASVAQPVEATGLHPVQCQFKPDREAPTKETP